MNAEAASRYVGSGPVLFLDLAGTVAIGPDATSDEFNIPQSCGYALKRIVDSVPSLAVIVTSEDCFNPRTLTRLGTFLSKFGVPRTAIVGTTPAIEPQQNAPAPKKGDEIRAWLTRHAAVRSHVTLDDAYVAYGAGPGFPRVVYVDPATGLTEKDANEAVRILKTYN
jgi:hypothetical protein